MYGIDQCQYTIHVYMYIQNYAENMNLYMYTEIKMNCIIRILGI